MRLYFCTDVHGSEKCWKKFLVSAQHYEADVVIVGGDITGKFIVPVVEGRRGTYTCQFMGIKRTVRPGPQMDRLRALIADSGAYSFVTTPDEEARLAQDAAALDTLFRKLITERAQRWIDMAEDRLASTGVRVMVSGANDDFFEVDELLAASTLIEDPNGRVIDLEDGIQIMGMGYGNPTPWDCPRDTSEADLTDRIDAVMARAADPGRTIMSLHVPPYDTGIDYAPQLDADLRAVVTAAGPRMVPVGSTASREAITRYHPLMGLHGHIHESRGVQTLDGVTIANPGSEYGEGILGGLLVDLDRQHGLVNTTLVKG